MSGFIGAHNIISPLGSGSSANFEALLQGKTALKQQRFPFSANPIMCAKVDETALDRAFTVSGNPSQYTHLEKLCMLSIQDVLAQSQLDLRDKNNLLILSTTKGNIDLLENKYKTIPEKRVYLPELAKLIGSFFKCANTPLVLSNACISGLLAMIIAKRFIRSGHYKNIVVCGADLVSEFTLSGFRSFNAMSEEACRPFDTRRNGINLGEAAASIVLHSEKTNICMRSGASANDANHISGPSRSGDGLYQAVRETLGGMQSSNIDFISAHGTATEYNDAMEAVAFSRSGLSNIPVNSLKGYYGHTLGAAGILESIVSIQCLEKNTLLRSEGYEQPGTAEPLNVITTTGKKELNTCLKTASGFGGCNAAAIFEKLS